MRGRPAARRQSTAVATQHTQQGSTGRRPRVEIGDCLARVEYISFRFSFHTSRG